MPEHEEHPRQHEEATSAALPRAIHIGIPIASILVLLTFALTIYAPANKSALPVQSTLFFIPVYVAIVIIFVFGSMYVFKKVLESDAGFKEE